MAATRRLAAILAADVVGYSRLIRIDEPGTLQRLRAIRAEIIDPAVATHNGRIVKTTGDGLLIEFASTVDALRCATEVQAAMTERNIATATEQRIQFRIGIHQGDIVAEDEISLVTASISRPASKRWPSRAACASRRGCRKTPPASSTSPFAISPSSASITSPVQCALTRSEQRRGRASRVGSEARLSAVLARSPSLFIAAAAWWSWSREQHTAATAQAPPTSGWLPTHAEAKAAPPLSLVVLPFTNLANDPDQEYFADGITDDLTTDLSRLPGSFVIARNTAFTFKGKPTAAKQIGHDLGVRYVVEGSVRRTGDQVQVNVQLIDTESGAHLWADRFDTDRRDLASAQAEITLHLARMLNINLIAAEAARSERRKALDPDARDFVMRGRDWLFQPNSSTTLKEARLAFERTLEIDPGSTEAPIGLATALGVAVTDASGSGSQDLLRAEQLALEAIERDPNSSQAHEALGRVRLRQKNRLREGQIEFETALALDRNNLGAIRQLGWALLHLGEPGACIPQADKGLRLSPRDPGVWNSHAQLGVCHLFMNQADLATDYLLKARAARPQIWWIPFHLAGALGLKGDLEGGKTALAESLKLKPEISSITQYLALKPWYSSPQELPIEDRTLLEGLRRLGFPES
jgi:TolB-like protein